MKLHKSQRSSMAEKICRQWIRQRRIRLAAPKVYVIFRQETRTRRATAVNGFCYWQRGYITLHLGVKSAPSEWLILLAHEYAHYLNYHTSSPKWRRENQPHGERFQRLLWRTLPVSFWAQASSGHWIRGRSAHRPQFQHLELEDLVRAA